MEHKRTHRLEKGQVELAAVVALAAVYFWFARGLLPADPLEPIVFLPFGDGARAGVFVLLLCGLGLFCAALTLSSRREGALLAVLIGAASVSFFSPGLRSLLEVQGGNVPHLYRSLIGEVAVLWCGLAICVVLIDLVRALLGGAFPQWAWRSPMADFTAEDGQRVAAAAGVEAKRAMIFHGPFTALFRFLGYQGTSRAAAAGGKPASLLQGFYSAALGLIVSVVLLKVLLQSPQRGQILFSLAASFTVGTLVANQVFYTPYSLFAWVTPALAGIFFYTLAAIAPAHAAPTQSWLALTLPGNPAVALPIDWLSVGAGGSVLGFWISCRLHELRILEKREKAEAAGE